MKNFDDYLKAVRLQCEEEKNGKYGDYFSVPSPAQLRNLCLVLFDNKLSKIDEAIFRIFFQVREEEDLRKAIENFNVVKFRSVRNFFTGKNEKTNMNTLNLIAVLVDYPSRPYNKFLKDDTQAEIGIQKLAAEEIQIQEEDIPQQEEHTSSHNPQKNDQGNTKPRSKHKVLILFLIGVSLLTGGYVAKDICFPEKKCMQWQNDHYEIVDCEVRGIMNISPIVALDEDVVNLKRVMLKKDMEFFKYKKPLYYYYKISTDSVEFFNAPGLHPITNEPLKKITWHMIDKYVK